ncbi:MAG: hypothetical protein U0V45_15395, partial [Flavobacteriales bacterium]
KWACAMSSSRKVSVQTESSTVLIANVEGAGETKGLHHRMDHDIRADHGSGSKEVLNNSGAAITA